MWVLGTYPVRSVAVLVLPRTSLAADNSHLCPSQMIAFYVSRSIGIAEERLKLPIFTSWLLDPQMPMHAEAAGAEGGDRGWGSGHIQQSQMRGCQSAFKAKEKNRWFKMPRNPWYYLAPLHVKLGKWPSWNIHLSSLICPSLQIKKFGTQRKKK